MTRPFQCDESSLHSLPCTAVRAVWVRGPWRLVVCLQPASHAECSRCMQHLCFCSVLVPAVQV